MRTWIKLYTEIIDDLKVARLTDRQFRLFILSLATAGAVDRDGELYPADELAWRLRLDAAGVAEDAAALTRAGFLLPAEPDRPLTLRAFAARNPAYPSDSNAAVAQRVREHRERKRGNDTSCNGKRARNDSVTSGNDKVTLTRQEQEQEQDIEQEQEEIKKQTSPHARASGGAVDNSDDDVARTVVALPALTAEEHVAAQFVRLTAPSFRDVETFVRKHDPRRVAYWALAAALDIDRLDNPAGLIRAMVERGADWPDLPGSEIQKYQTAVRSNAWRNNGHANGKDGSR